MPSGVGSFNVPRIVSAFTRSSSVNVCMEALVLVRYPAVREGLDEELRRALARKEFLK